MSATIERPAAAHDPRYIEALRRLWMRSAYDRGFISNPFAGDADATLGLQRTRAVLERLGNPDERLRILHVAGSKGKGSVCAFAAAILSASGRRTGLYTSPHLHSFRERMAIDGEAISEADFARLCERAFDAVDEVERARPELGQVTTFELTTAMAFDWFASRGCEDAVVEVGLGGLLDATNVVDPAASVISVLDYEHTRVLGSTIAEIAANKAGIIKPSRPVATASLVPQAESVVRDAVTWTGSDWLSAGRDWSWQGTWRAFDAKGPWGAFRDLAIGLPGTHQVDNACLAIAGLWLMTDGALRERDVRAGLAAAVWPGRFEVVARGTQTIVLDGAHTPAATSALASAFREEFGERRATVVLGLLSDKDPLAIAEPLLPVAERFIAVKPNSPRGLAAEELAESLATLGITVEIAPTVESAIASIDTGLALVTGSLTTVASAREALGLAVADPSFTA